MKTTRMLAIPRPLGFARGRLRSGWRACRAILVLALGLMVWPTQVSQAAPIGTAFTYQGRLIDADIAADAHYDFEFSIYDSPADGNELAIPERREDIDVVDGYFTVELGFGGAVFTGDERWLQIGVRPGELNDPNGYTPLHPRQRVSPVPYALYALSGSEGPPGPPGDSHWISNGANIYYVEGNVGVGTDRPNSKLEAIAIAPTPSIFAFNGGTGAAVVGESIIGDGIAGESVDPNRSGVSGHSVNGVGVSGRSDENDGVVGRTNVANKSGVYGWSEFGYGVTGRSEAVSGRGLFGVATDTNGVGVYGKSDSGYAAYFEGKTYFDGRVGIGITPYDATLEISGSTDIFSTIRSTHPSDGYGVDAESTGGYGVRGSSSGGYVAGVVGEGCSRETWGVYGVNRYPDGIAVRGLADQGWAGYFLGPKNFFEGNVGIGTDTPNDKLEVKGGGIQLTDEWSNIYGKNLKIWGEDNSNLLLQSPAGAGNVGIGTTNPKYTLDVDGNIRATGSVYYGGTEGNTNGTAYSKPDYVFEKGYHVMSTDQVEAYLKKENHLPWITSAEQEEQQHASVIDMTRMAFETVETAENLQMQLIQLNKLIKEQGALVREQQRRIAALEQRLDVFRRPPQQHEAGIAEDVQQ
ncbi:MAG: hypothetical protein JSU94_21120 [Phycisphaerales bacterium]|nr:MAG: hypothetical protein JSU94_21120 [Phycisphaerales bacterium]